MQLILLEKVTNLGNLGETVKVKAGYGRNFLVPQGKAVYATKKNIEHFADRKGELEAKAQVGLEQAQKRAAAISVLTNVVIKAHAGDEGKLYGSVGAREISDAVTTMGVELAKKEVLLPNGPLRNVGEHEVNLSLHTDVQSTLKFTVVGEE